MLWEVDIYPLAGQPDRTAEALTAQAADVGILADLRIAAARGYLIQGELSRADVERAAQELLVDTVVERCVVGQAGDARLLEPPAGLPRLVHVLPKPGVMDPVAQSTLDALADLGLQADAVPHAAKILAAGVEPRRRSAAWPPKCWPTTQSNR